MVNVLLVRLRWFLRRLVLGTVAVGLGASSLIARSVQATSPPSLSSSATATATALPLTLETALDRAETGSGLVRRARAEKATIEAHDVGARAWFPANPVVAVAVGRRREEQGPGTNLEGVGYAIHAEQTFEVANQRGVRRAEVARAVDVATWRETLARAETRARVRAVYVGAQLAAAQVRSARGREELVRTLVDGVRARVDSGAASNVDLELARLEHGRSMRDRITAELAAEVALTDLRVLIALEPGTPIELTSPLATPTEPPALAALLSRAGEHRAELRVLESSQATLDAAIVRLRREAVPSPTLFMDVQRDLPGQVYVGGGIALPLPAWRRNQGELVVARAERARLREEEDVAFREIAAEVERAYRAALAHARMVSVVEKELLPAAEAGVDLVTQGWRAGKFDLFRVIQASREASDARRGQLESLGALWQATIAVDRATGTP